MALGLQKLNFKPQPPKAQASQGMSSQTRATGAATRGAVGQNVGKLDQRGTMALFGIDAQRSNRVFGNMKAGYSQGISNLRHSMNDYRMRIDEFWVNPSLLPTKNSQIQNSGMSDMQKLMELQALMGGITQMGKGVADIAGAIKDTKGSSAPKSKEVNDTPDPADVKNKGNSGKPSALDSAVSKSISGLENAKDAKALETNIKIARQNLDTMTSKLTKEEGELSGLQAKTPELQADVTRLDGEIAQNSADQAKTENSIGDLTSKVAKKKAECAKNPKNNALASELSTLEKQLNQEKANLKKLKSDEKELTKQKEAADKALKDNETQITQKSEQVNSTKQSKVELENSIYKAVTKLESMQSQNGSTVKTAMGDVDAN